MSESATFTAGYCLIWEGDRGVGSHLGPGCALEVELALPDYKEGAGCMLLMPTRGVNLGSNEVSLNGSKVGNLIPSTGPSGFTALPVRGTVLSKGTNRLRIAARDRQGGTSGDVDDFIVKDPVLLYAVE